MPKVSKFICDGASGVMCNSEVKEENGFSVVHRYPYLEIRKGIFEEKGNFYFCSEGCLLKYLTQAIRELK